MRMSTAWRIGSRNPVTHTPYFGRRFGSPPGLPGGGITGVLPVSGVGARISGSTPEGGHNTPLDFASLSPSGSPLWPVVVPSGATVPRGGTGRIGMQSPERRGAGGAVCAGGVAGPGGACALATPDAAIRMHERRAVYLIRMPGKRLPGAEVPPRLSRFAVSDQRKMSHWRHRPAPGEADAAMPGGPVDQTGPWKFRPPAEPPRQRCKRELKGAARAAFGADVVDQDQFTAG